MKTKADDHVFMLDSNVFIEASRRYYAFDIAPKFWDSLLVQAKSGLVLSIDRVKYELDRGKDELSEWVNKKFSDYFLSTDEDDTIKRYGDIINWVQSQSQFSAAAKSDFAYQADGWLVAYSIVHGCYIVTHEMFNVETKKKIPIPNICKAFNVSYVDTFEMLRKLSVRFV